MNRLGVQLSRWFSATEVAAGSQVRDIVMDTYDMSSKSSIDHEAIASVQSVGRDFNALLDVFDQALGALPHDDGQARSSLLEARAAAERGRVLSEEMIRLIRTAG